VVLGVDYDADASAIKAAFRSKAKQLHPDVNQAADAEAAFRLLKRAHEVLSDSMLRAAHDTELREQLPEASAALRARDPRFARWVHWGAL
jgi:DnaJ-class molecular chaperone